MSRYIYLDYAAATPTDERVLEAMLPYLGEKFHNPSANYLPSRQIAKDLQSARERVAEVLGAKPGEIIFTAGGTEANNLALHGIMRRFPGANLAISGIEHDSVLKPAENYTAKIIAVEEDGRVKPETVRTVIDDKTVLVSVIYASNEIGTVQPLSKIAAEINGIRKLRLKSGNKLPLYLHTDASQAGNYLDLHASRLSVDMMTLNGGKIYGPKQSGALYVKAGIELMPLIEGGGQERGLRSGTESVANAVGLAKSLEAAQTRRHKEADRLKELQRSFISLLAEHLPEARLNGSLKHRLPNNIHITVPGSDNERLLVLLDEAGILCAAGSACSASKEQASPVLAAIGLDEAAARSSLRFSMGRGTTQGDIEQTVRTLEEITHG